jgi:hypothetical protein
LNGHTLPSTGLSERTPDTVTWFPQHVKIPVASSAELIVATVHDILHALQQLTPGSALAPLTDSERGALTSIADILLNRNPTASADDSQHRPNSEGGCKPQTTAPEPLC